MLKDQMTTKDMEVLSADDVDAVSGGAIHIVAIVLLCLAIRACGTAQGCQ